jgi:hypothetical protein
MPITRQRAQVAAFLLALAACLAVVPRRFLAAGHKTEIVESSETKTASPASRNF